MHNNIINNRKNYRILKKGIALIIMLFVSCTQSFGQLYTPLYNLSSFSNPINVSLAVGAIEGQASVTQGGAATYTIPVKCPPGNQGVMPQTTLVYNSMGNNGDLGMGWSLGGLSAITRKTKDYYFDHIVAPIQYNNTDDYSLDGMQLIPLGGNTYSMECEDFSSITAYGVTSTGPDHFIVVKKDGTTVEYGNTSDSRLVPSGGSVTSSWRIDKITDANGNYCTFTYGSTGWESHIAEIDYTGNAGAGLSPYNKITFTYTTGRVDPNRYYDANTFIEVSSLLTGINITGYGGVAYKSYVLNYATDNLESYLKSVVEKDGSGNQLNSTIFRYGDAPTPWTVMGSLSGIPGYWESDADFFPCDFSGTGTKDMVVAHKSTVGGIPYNTSLDIYSRNFSSGAYTLRSTIPLPSSFEKIDGVTLPSNYSFQPADFNGDGYDDILITNGSYTGSEAWLTVNSFDIAQGNPWSGYYGPTYYWGSYPAPTVSGFPDPFNVVSPHSGQITYPGDFDGDGICDFFTVLSDKTGYKTFMYQFSSGGSFTNKEVLGLYPAGGYSNLTTNGIRMYVIDFDGDGKDELMVVTPNPGSMTYVWTFTNDGHGTFTANLLYSGGYPEQQHDIYFGDFNGDGKTDMLTRIGSTYTSSNWQVAIANGTGWGVQPFTFANTPQQNESIAVADFNGDGKSDVILKRNSNNTSSTNYFDIYYFQSCPPSSPPTFSLTSTPAYTTFCTANMIASDIDGDGRADIVNVPKNACMSGSPVENTVSFFNRGQEHLLQSVIDGMGNQTTFQYDNLASGNTYTKGTGSTYPLNDFQAPLYAATGLIIPNGLGGTTTTNYNYSSAVLHKQGKGLLGYKKVVATNTTTNISTESDYGINTTNYVPYMTNTSSSQSGTSLSSTSYTFSFSGASGSFYYRTLTGTNENNILTGAYKNTSTTYDAYGNATSTTININGQENQVTNNTYIAAVPTLTSTPGFVSVSKKTNTRTGAPAITVETDYTYDTHGNIATENDNATCSLYVKKTLTHDAFGNVTNLQLNGGGIPSPTIYSYVYDATGRFPVTYNYPGGQHETAVFDPLWGKVTSKTNIMGNTTTYAYNTWGNLKTVNVPEGYTINISEGWNSTPTPTQTWYSLVSNPGKPDEKIWHDALGREVQKLDESWGGAWTTVATTYDIYGNILSKTKPYISGVETPYTTTYAYNSLNQEIGETYPSPFGSTSCSYSYSGGNTTVSTTDAGGHVTTKTTDATKKVLSSSDASGSLRFTYDSWGNTLQITNSLVGIPMTTNTYDVAGRLASSHDIDGGLTTYVYDAFGRPVNQTDAKGNITNFVYDGLSRVIQRGGTEGTTSYTYPSAGTGINSPITVVNPSGITDQYVYDGFGRQTQHVRTYAGTTLSFNTSQTYDMYDNITRISYPSGVVVNHNFDANGFLSSVTTNISTSSFTENVFTGISMNGSGEYTQYSLGNGLTTTKTYNYGIPTLLSTPGVQNLSLSYDYANNNLISRYDGIENNGENFTYDGLNRLTASQVNRSALVGGYWMSFTEPPINVSYDGHGNITSKTDIGSMAYGQFGASIHAVTDVADVSGDISHQRQFINYAPFNKANKIIENGYEEDITYDANHDRAISVIKNGATTVSTRYYLDNCEYNVPGSGSSSPYYVSYINGGDGLAAIASGTSSVYHLGASWLVPACYFTYKDQLGSILAVTDNTGTVLARQNFDAWGRYRNPTSLSYMTYPYGSPGTTSWPSWLYRGYTGHEHMNQFDLVNMNGRIYDPILSRMLRPDDYVQSPFSIQGYNRYSYCMNNPMRYSDPTGNFYVWDDALVFGVGFVVGYVGKALATGNWGGNDWKYGLEGGAIAELSYLGGGLAGGYGLSSFTYMSAADAVSTNVWSNAVSWAVGYGTSALGAMYADKTQIAQACGHGNDGFVLMGGIELISGIGEDLSAGIGRTARGEIDQSVYAWNKTPVNFLSRGFTVDLGSTVSTGFTTFSTSLLEKSYSNGTFGGLSFADYTSAAGGAFEQMGFDLVDQLAQYKFTKAWNSQSSIKRYMATVTVRCPDDLDLADDDSRGLISNILLKAGDSFHSGDWMYSNVKKLATGGYNYLYNSIKTHNWNDFSAFSPL